jgi:uroporphyrinogen III methyltransferase/synthase
MPDTRPLDRAIKQLARYDWVIFTSVNGVSIFWERMAALDEEIDIFEGVHVAAIGPATGDALAQRGVEPDFIPDEFVAERIAEGLGDVSGLSILLPRAQLARETLATMLEDKGARVDEIATYRTLPATPDPEALDLLQQANIFTFTSSSTVRNFVDLAGGSAAARRLTVGALIACIGPITADTAAALGLEADIVADEYTMEGLVAALVEHVSQKR